MPNKITIQCDSKSIESVQAYIEQCLIKYQETHTCTVDLNYDENRAGDKTIKISSE